MQFPVDGAGTRGTTAFLGIRGRWAKTRRRWADGVVRHVEENRGDAVSESIEGAAGAGA